MLKTTKMILDELKDYATPKAKLARMVKQGIYFPVRKGLYETRKNISHHLLAASIYGPSYVSFEYALAYHNMIPEAVYAVTSATFEKKKRKMYETMFGRFLFQDVPSAAFPWGLDVVWEDDYYCFRIAGPEKALCDKLYIMPPVYTIKDMWDMVVEDLRIDEDDLLNLDTKLVDFLAPRYGSTNVKKLNSLLKRMHRRHGKGGITVNPEIKNVLEKYNPENLTEQKNTTKEIIQEIVLCGLSRTNFFDHAAFYGSTALRIFHGLNRFSEDLDFSLESPQPNFSLSDYLPILEKEVRAFGFNMDIQQKNKSKESNIQSAFLKGNIKEYLLLFYPCENNGLAVDFNDAIKIKLKIDVMPPAYASFEQKYRLSPCPYNVRLYDMPSLFAGKIHAILCRGWRSRVEGRDLYDYIFYLTKETPVNLRHLRERLIQSGFISKDDECSINTIKELLRERFRAIDFAQAQKDVTSFLNKQSTLNYWNADFFDQVTESLVACNVPVAAKDEPSYAAVKMVRKLIQDGHTDRFDVMMILADSIPDEEHGLIVAKEAIEKAMEDPDVRKGLSS